MITDISKIGIFIVLFFCFWACSPKAEDDPTPPEKQVLAFPEADGGGKYTTGGRGTSVYVVSSLEDDPLDPKIGTLRRAIQSQGRRIIIFNVAGRIDLVTDLEIKSGNVTILGQSAPGDGICISGCPLVVRADNVIIRFMRFRMGDARGKEADALTVEKGHKNILIDHCSCSWCTDECLSIYGVQDATVQYCIISESLNNSVHAKGAHGYAGIWGGENTTFHHNLLAHHSSRMPRFDHDYVTTSHIGPADFINNVVYNWGSNSAYGGESRTGNRRQYNFVANYYKSGPATKSGVRTRLLNPWTKCGNCGSSVTPGLFYLAGNCMDGSTDVTNDNWKGVHMQDGEEGKKDQCRSYARIAMTTPMTTEQDYMQAYNTVLAKAGCSLKRDTVDKRIVNEVRQGTYTYQGSNGSSNGLIDSPDDVGGWPVYEGTASKDSDYDGMPDTWELANGLNPNDPSDAKATNLSDPYLNIEVYLNAIVAHLY